MSTDRITDSVVAQQLARTTLRAHSAEMMLYSLNGAVQAMRADVQKLHDLNDKYPLGDGTPAGVRDMLVKALRASVPGMATKTDDEIAAAYKL
jgi:hypothetical protein